MKKETIELLNILNKEIFFKEQDFALIGGTALSIHLNHRLSEDLDFMLTNNNDLPIDKIKELMKKYNAIPSPYTYDDLNQFDDLDQNDAIKELEKIYKKYTINDIKVEFIYKNCNLQEDDILTNENCENYNNGYIKIASIETIFKQKVLLTFFERNKIRDMFDLYSLIKENHFSFNDIIDVIKNYRDTYTLNDLEKKIMHKKQMINDEPLDHLFLNNQTLSYDELKDFFINELNLYKEKEIEFNMR